VGKGGIGGNGGQVGQGKGRGQGNPPGGTPFRVGRAIGGRGRGELLIRPNNGPPGRGGAGGGGAGRGGGTKGFCHTRPGPADGAPRGVGGGRFPPN